MVSPVMDPAYDKKKIIDLSDEELVNLGFMGENVAPEVKDIVEQVKADPVNLGSVTCFMIDCVRRRSEAAEPSIPPPSGTLTNAEIHSELIDGSDPHAIVAPDLISKFEMRFYYHGLSGDPPQLMWRSDFETNPFPTPQPGSHFFTIPTKTAHGVFNTPLNGVWDVALPRIIQSLKEHHLRWSAIHKVRFSIEDSEGETLGPVVVWIAVHPNTTTAEAVRDATPDILKILADYQITDVVVEWYEGAGARLIDSARS